MRRGARLQIRDKAVARSWDSRAFTASRSSGSLVRRTSDGCTVAIRLGARPVELITSPRWAVSFRLTWVVPAHASECLE